ncbi:MAG: glycosyltransferase family 2 protein [Muribaculaceae bacterium]|nr:glycosyltransferase family 2 protein [Muribaculaceae bacterium]
MTLWINILDYAFEVIDDIHSVFTANLRWSEAINLFWFLIFIEFPRYYMLDIIVAFRYNMTYRKRRARQAVARRQLYIERPLVTILAPGKNEGKQIYKLVKTLREQTYQNYEIIIVDDGSDDATPLICRDLQKAGYIHKFFRNIDRGGKASAANYGAYHANGKYLVHLDADSSLDRDAIEKILLPFYYDRKIKGVGGCVKVRNTGESFCAAMQTIEYLKTIQIGRLGSSMMGIYHIISGAFGAFEVDTLKQIGYWDVGPGLDGDITQKIRKAGYKVTFAHDAICMTNVPVTWSALFKQRRRWSKSLVRFRWRKHRDILMPNKNFNFLNWASNMENIVYDFILNYVWLFYIIGLFFASADRLIEVVLIALIIRWTLSLISFSCIMSVSERWREEKYLAGYLLLNTFYTGYFIRLTRLVAHTEELFFRTSYKDPWNPEKTSQVAQIEGS